MLAERKENVDRGSSSLPPRLRALAVFKFLWPIVNDIVERRATRGGWMILQMFADVSVGFSRCVVVSQ